MALDKAPTFTVTVLDVEVSIDRFALQSLARSHYCKQVIGNATLTARIHCTGIKFETTWIIRACTLLRDLQYPLHVKSWIYGMREPRFVNQPVKNKYACFSYFWHKWSPIDSHAIMGSLLM